MDNLKFRLALEDDIRKVLKIYSHILDCEEKGTTTTGWKRGIYPTLETAQEAFDEGELYVCTNKLDRVIAAARINQNQLPMYYVCDWHFKVPDNQVLVLHTLVVDPQYSSHGIGTAFMHFFLKMAEARGCTELRIDTNVRNKTARRLYKKLGYTETGIVPCQFNGLDDINLVLLEKYIGAPSTDRRLP